MCASDAKPCHDQAGGGRQFTLRRMMLAVTLTACVLGALSGAFGLALQLMATLLVMPVLLAVGFTFVMAAPWLALMWFCTSIAELLSQARASKRDSTDDHGRTSITRDVVMYADGRFDGTP